MLTRARTRQWAWLAAIGIGLLLIAVYYAQPSGSDAQTQLYRVIGLSAVAATVVGLRLHRPPGASVWLLMAAGQFSFVVGDIIWGIYTSLGEDPYPSIADVAYIAGYPLIAAGLALSIRRRVAGGDRASLFDAAILTTGAGVIWWALVLGPQAMLADPEPLSFSVAVAYPLGDLLLLGMALALVVTPGARSASFRLLIASLVAMLVADLAWNIEVLDDTYADGTWIDSLWLAAYVLFGAAGLHPSMAELVEPRPVSITLLGRVRIVLLGGAMLVGPTLLLLERSATDSVMVVVAVTTAVMSVLVLGRLGGMVRHLSVDIERRKALEEQLSYQAFHDPLTGLANRRRFIASVDRAIDDGGPIAAMFLDLDDFKHVNDEMGHDAGDTLLLAVGERLLGSVRPGDLVGRLGGDEFAVLLLGVESTATTDAMAKRLVAALAQPVEIEGRQVNASVSVGLATRLGDERPAVDELLRRADVAMYHAKARGKNGAATWYPEMDTPAAGAPSLVRRPAPAA